MEYEIVKRRRRRNRNRGDKKIVVLIVSAIVALIVIGVGVFGGSELNKNNRNKGKQEKSDQKIIKTETTKEDNKDIVEEQTTAQDETAGSPETTQADETQNVTETQETQETEAGNGETETANVPTETQSNGQEGQQETTAQGLVNNAVSTQIDPNKPMVALTFDDGPSRTNTERLLNALQENQAHATFFVVGYNLNGNEDILKRAVEQGNEIGNHTSNHAKLTGVDDAGLDAEIGTMRQRIIDITGQSMVVIRPPYGAIDDRVMAHIADPVVLWSIDTEDWKTRNAAATVQNIQQSVYDGAIILMHDIHTESVDAAVQIIPWLKQQGYQLVTMSELGYYRRGGLQTGIRYGSLPPQ